MYSVGCQHSLPSLPSLSQTGGGNGRLGPGVLDPVDICINRGSTSCNQRPYPEGTPRTVLEALAMGKPVITTDAPGCRETVIDGGNGFLIPTRHVTALAGAMRKFVQEPRLTPKMGVRSRRLAETHYDVEQVNGYLWSEVTKVARVRAVGASRR